MGPDERNNPSATSRSRISAITSSMVPVRVTTFAFGCRFVNVVSHAE